jgi:hypothetical protein
MSEKPKAEKPVAMLFAKTTRKTEIANANKLFYGFPKTGKTTLASVQRTPDGREPLFVATEDGHGALEVFVQRVTTWEGFVRLCDHIGKNGQTIAGQHSCLVLDLITDLDQWCGQAIAKKYNVAHISDMDFGKGFSLAREEFQTQLNKLMAVLPITYIAHAAEKEINWNGEKIKVQSPSLSKGALDFVNGKVDMIGYISPASSKKEKAELLFKPEKGTIAGSRFPQLARSFEIDYANPSSTMAAIQTAFNAPVTTQKGETK